MRLGTEGYSPAVLRKAVRQNGKAPSCKDASDDLRELLGIRISPSHLHKLTRRIGQEWADARDADVQAFQDRRLSGEYSQPPQVAAVMIDGGRLQTREEDRGRNPIRPPSSSIPSRQRGWLPR